MNKGARKFLRRLAVATVVVLALAGILIGGAWWALHREDASQWLLRQLPGLEIEGVRGGVLGEFTAERVVYRFGREGAVTLTGVRWRGLDLYRSGIKLEALHADTMDIVTDPSAEPAKAPANLRLPLNIDVRALDVGRLSVAGQTLSGLRGGLSLGALEHRVTLDALGWQKLQLSGQARVQTLGDMAAEVSLALAPTEKQVDLPDWRGTLTLKGPLASPEARAEVRAAGQSLQAHARLQPFASWPLSAATLQARNLDLAALLQDAPRTALTGEAQLQSKGLTEPFELSVQLRNELAGRWDQQRLPVQRLTLALQGQADQPDRLRLTALDADLGKAGRIAGQGALKPGQAWELTAKLSGIRPELLDARLSPLLLGGTAQASGSPAGPLKLTTKLDGMWQQLPLRLSAEASLQGRKLQVPQALLESGRSRLSLAGQADLSPKGWTAEAQAQAQAFDPRLLWKGTNPEWQRGRHSLDAKASFKLRQGKTLPQGTALVELLPGSVLAGMPLSGKLDFSGAAEAQLSSELRLAEVNRLLAVSRANDGLAAVQTQAELAAPRLAALNPLLALVAPGLKLDGAAEGKFGVQAAQQKDRRWQGSSDGALTLRKFRSDALALQQAQVRWAAGMRPDSPLLLTAAVEGPSWDKQRLDRLDIDLQGTWAAHKLALSGRGAQGEAKLNLTGALAGTPLAPQDWRARIGELLLRTADASQPALLKAAELDLQVRLRDFRPTAASLAPGRAEVAGAKLRWATPLQWSAGTLQAEVELEPLAVAPLLSRWQPDFGWSGPLTVTGRARLRSTPQLDAEIVLERASGDLSVTDERGVVQNLGLTDLRLGLTVKDGLWQFTQALAGTNMGSLGGAVTVHADRAALWPAKGSKLEGVLQANVARVGTWGAWLPPGWRLGGSLAAELEMAGTLGAPQLRGKAEGQDLAVRNPLHGVNMSDGAFKLTLEGETARLLSFTASAGPGTLTAEGEAKLGAQPSARLSLKADRFAALSRVDRRVVASGQAQLRLGAEAIELAGKLRVDEGLFDFSQGNAPSLDSDVRVIRANDPPLPEQPVAKAEGKPRQLRIDLALDLGSDLKLKGHGLDTRLRGELKLTHRDAGGLPQLTGTVRAVGGTYQAYGQKLEVERGDVVFSGAYDNPRLDVLAVRPDIDTRVGVSVTGTAQAPRIKLFSEPEMSDTDKLSWLLLGRAPDGLGRTDTALLQRAALALLAGEGESTSGKVLRQLGLDELSLSQAEGSDTRGTIVRLGKQISRRWYVGYERGLNATTGSWQLVYRIAQRFTLRAQTGESNALDLIWQWKWE